VHHISDFIHSAQTTGLTIQSFNEWWHEDDQGKLPRLVSFLFRKMNEGGKCNAEGWMLLWLDPL